MKPLKIALVVKPSASTTRRDDRNMGYWSYPVDDCFTWQHFQFGSFGSMPKRKFDGFDLVFIEDGGNWGKFVGDGPPIVYMSIDDTLSEAHLRDRVRQSFQSNLALVDHGSLAPFKMKNRPVRRLNYCVNDKVFMPSLAKEFDVTFHCAANARQGIPGGEERTAVRQQLDTICKRHGWSYRSGVCGLEDYAANMSKSRVIVNWPRTVINRPHRVFDAMASGAALLTGPIPQVDGDGVFDGVHYRTFTDVETLEKQLVKLLTYGEYEHIAIAGNVHVAENHTWDIRAVQLRTMLNEVLGL